MAPLRSSPDNIPDSAGPSGGRRLQVLVVTNLWPTEADPGWGSFVKAQMESLRPLGVDYDVVFINGRESRANYLRQVREVRRRLGLKRYDLIHAHFGLSGWVARFQWRVPVVVSFMGDDVLGRFDRRGRIGVVGRFYQVSSFVLARLVAAAVVKNKLMKARLRLEPAHVIPNGVDLDLFRPMDRAEARCSLKLDPGRKYVVFPYDPAVANKRFDLIEAAVRRAQQDVPELELLRVDCVPHRQMPLYLNAADVLVLASHSEGSPNIVKEAMAVNLPVASVNVGDVAELIGPTKGCHLVPRGVEEIAAAIVEVVRSGVRTEGRTWIMRYALENVARDVVAVYRSVAAESGSGGM